MKNIVVIAMLLCIGIACTGCSSGNNSSQVQTQQTQIVAMQTQLSAIQTQLSSAKVQNTTYSGCLGSAITSLTQTQSTLAQLLAQPASSPISNIQKSPNALDAASNQVLVLQSIVASISSNAQNLATAYNTALASIATLTTQLNSANAQVTSLTSQLATSQNSNSTLSSLLTATIAQVTTLIGQIATLNTAAATLQSQLNTANGTISTQTATITSLNSTISTLNAQISTMVATPVLMSVSTLISAVSTTITVTAMFPSSENGKTATFTATGGNLLTTPTTATITGNTASTTFSSASTGTFNIYVVDGLYAGGAIISVTAVPPVTYIISGNIALNGTGLQNVIVALTGDATNSATTDINGNYSFAGVANGSYTVTPALSGYSFTPSSISVTVSGANASNQNFIDIITQTYSCNGTLSPLGRWCDNGNGTVRDMTTGLIWLQDAGWGGRYPWWSANMGDITAFDVASQVANGTPASLTDGSASGDWRLPTVDEFMALTTGTEAVLYNSTGPFSNVQNSLYWSSNSNTMLSVNALLVNIDNGIVSFSPKNRNSCVWPVRSGQLVL